MESLITEDRISLTEVCGTKLNGAYENSISDQHQIVKANENNSINDGVRNVSDTIDELLKLDIDSLSMEMDNGDEYGNLHAAVQQEVKKVKKSTLSRNRSKTKGLHVHFKDDVRVIHFEYQTDSEVSESDLKKQQDILRMMFTSEVQESQNTEDKAFPGWSIITAVMSASKRLAALAKMSLSYPTEKDPIDPLKRYAIDGLSSSVEIRPNSHSDEEQFLEVSDVDILSANMKERVIKLSQRLRNNKQSQVVEEKIERRNSNEETLFRFTTVEDPWYSPGKIKIKSNITIEKVREKTDPFQFFEIEHEPCHMLKVRVICGRGISKGRLQDMIDTPDPYVVIHIRAAPDGKKSTRVIDNDPDPEWDEELTYLLPAGDDLKIIAEIHLKDSNYALDETYGSVEFDVSTLGLEEKVFKTFNFNETSEVDMEFYKEVIHDPDLRCSLALCDEEKLFRSTRKRIVHKSMKDLLKKKGAVGPRNLREVPTIAVLGSGGGFRAMTGYSGAMKALHSSGILDCCTYVSGLSGSSWYLSTLYANESFPKKGTDAANKEIRKNIQTSPFWLLRPECLMTYSHRLHAKMKSGQPVTFVDFFGMLIGQTLLGQEKTNKAKLSDFHEKIKDGIAPMPVLTCLHVRPKTSAMTFHDWVEFTPYEVGMPKYGTFMKTQHFGSKFFMGVMAKKFDESPLHFLMGVWGSAFSILFNRLVEKSKGISKNDKKTDDIRGELEKELNQTIENEKNMGEEDSDEEFESEEEQNDDDDDDMFEDAVEERSPLPKKATDKRPSLLSSLWSWGIGAQDSVESIDERPRYVKKKAGGGLLNSIIGGVFGSNIMESREYRAGKILNYMRGVSLNKTYPLSPFTTKPNSYTIAEDGEFQKLHEPMEVKRKKVHLVDAGLTFNSPYPAMLRPQRAVDLILSFDFSARPSEDCEPFKEILLAEKWARMHHLPFPNIDRTVYEREGMKECYVFKDESDERAPIILHFVLCNIQYRKFSAPGVPRKSGDSRGDFNIFSTPKTPYSTFNFQYSNDAFDRLHKLTEFNTLLHIDTIIEEILGCIKLRRHSQTRGSITLNDIRNSVHLSERNKKSLESTILKSGENGKMIPID